MSALVGIVLLFCSSLYLRDVSKDFSRVEEIARLKSDRARLQRALIHAESALPAPGDSISREAVPRERRT